MENIFAKGGKTKVKYDYIPQKAIDELSYTIDKVTKGISGDKLLSGVYVKSDAKSKTKSGSNLTAKILAMTDDEDKKEVILEKDVKEFQKYISDKLITAFYLGLPLAYDFKGDYSYGGGVITMVVDDAKRKTTQAIKNAKNKKFELGLKYPQYDFEKLLGKPIIKDVFGKTMTFNDGTTEKYQYRLWIWKDCVIGQTIGSENSSRGFKDFTYGEKPTLMGGYKSVQTSKESKLESIINFMAKDKDGFVKDNNVLYNGLGGANFETLETNKIKYAKGGEMDSEDIVSVYQFGKEKDADDFFLMADKFTDYDVLRLSPFAIQYVGGKEGFEFLYDRAETYESNSLDLYAKGGMIPFSSSNLYFNSFGKDSNGNSVIKVSFPNSRAFSIQTNGDLPKTHSLKQQYSKIDNLSDKDLKIVEKEVTDYVKEFGSDTQIKKLNTYAKGGKTKRSKHSLMQDRRRVSSEPWEVAYQKRKSKMEAGGTLPTPFGQAGLVGETGAMNEMDLFAMGGGLPQGVHQYYAQTYNPAYPTPHGYAKGGVVEGRYVVSVVDSFGDERVTLFRSNDKEEASRKYYELREPFFYKSDVNLVDTKNGQQIEYYDSAMDREERGYAKGGKLYYQQDGIGQSKYTVSFYDGKKTHKDGSPFYDIAIFKNKKDLKSYIEKLESEGYKKKFAKGGMTDVERQSMIDMGYTQEQIKESEDNPRRGGRFAKGGEIVVKGIDKNGGEFYREFDSYENALEEISQPHFNYLDRDSIRYYDENDDMIFAKGGKIGFDGLAKKVAKKYEGKPVKEKFQSEYGKTYSKAEAMEVGKKVAGKVYRQQQSMAKGGEIQMSEVYNVNGKDYLFSTPIQNAKGTYTGWDAYEVVYDTFDGEKHLNYTKTKKGKSKYFPNGVKRTEAEDYFAKGGVLSLNKKLKSYIDTLGKEDLISMRNELGREIDKGILDESKYKDELAYLNNRIGKDMYAKGGKTQGYNDKLDESLGNTKGKRSTKEQNYKDRRNESEAMKKKGGKRKYSSVKTMDKGSRSKRKTPLTLAKEIRKEGEKWQDAVKRASAILKKEAK